ncbi:MAG TPA: radical SAM/SPASM domain-containing protein [Elusimicrobia bacterium]|nr:radical SAM/SPASM domain-containing protein [Elusimicrobiota bacterium]
MENYQLACCVWEFTLACNLNCIHCGSSAGKKRADELTTEEAFKLCEDLKKTGCLGVALMGGEPFLRKDFWRVAQKIRGLGMELSVITNGTIVDEEIIKKLVPLSPRAVAVSIDAAAPEIHDHIRGRDGAFADSWKFIELALKHNLPVSVITTVHKLNIGELAKMRDQLKGRKIAWQVQTAGSEGRRFSKDLLLDEEEFYSVGLFIEATRRGYCTAEMPVIGAHDLGFNSRMLKNTSLQGKWEGCQAGISVLGVRSNGDVLGCLSINDDKYVEGNVRKAGVFELWNSPSSFAWSRRFKPEQAGSNCAPCKYLDSCKGGCNEMSLMKTGHFHNDPRCFWKIEQRLFQKELNSPLGRAMLKLRGFSVGYGFRKLAEIFRGER